MMNRAAFLDQITERKEWDFAIIGGGATGMGIAVDAASRGYSVVLLDASDFGKATSSRSTKLVHGGVRYLQQGNIALVREALKERGILLKNAPHLAHDLEFIVPGYQWWETPFYGTGMKVYDALSGRHSLGKSQILSRRTTLERIPTLRADGLKSGVLYHDGQFDDARLVIALAQTAAADGACLLNYARVTRLQKDSSGRISGLTFRDEETQAEHTLQARCVINATGVFCDELRRIDEPTSPPMLALSQGAHIVLPRRFLPGSTALMVPRTRDGRVMFAIPWHNHVVVGTTDTPVPVASFDPAAQPDEIALILETAAGYLVEPPTPGDVLSVFTGIRPLVRATGVSNTAKLSRDHTIQFSASGLLTITGGKWTTYRHMAEDAVNQAVARAGLTPKECVTREHRIHGHHANSTEFGALSMYGADAPAIQELAREKPELAAPLHPALPFIGAQVVWAARHEMARTLDDVLARRTRALFLNQRAALEMAPATARLLAAELGKDAQWQEDQLAHFRTVAAQFAPPSPVPNPNPVK